jgi:glutathione S-transferase
MITVYGAPGWGSAISELMLTLADIPYQFENVEGFDSPGHNQEKLLKLNPLCQVPTLQLDDGSIMTESAAIALMILDEHPHLALRPVRLSAISSGDCWSGWWQMFTRHSPMPTIPNASFPMRRISCATTVSPIEITLYLAGTAITRHAVRVWRTANVVGYLYLCNQNLGATA